MVILVKICGLSDEATLDSALDAGADVVGLVSFPNSPRHVSPERAAVLAGRAKGRARVALLTVDADDALLAELVSATTPDILQLHGAETPSRAIELKRRYGREVWKAIAVSDADDLARVEPYWTAADRVVFDAKAPKGAPIPGGNGLSFDWTLISGLDPARSFVLSGGLNTGNLTEALRVTRASAIDVSSGVESAPGVKDPALIAAFVREARTASLRTEGHAT